MRVRIRLRLLEVAHELFEARIAEPLAVSQGSNQPEEDHRKKD